METIISLLQEKSKVIETMNETISNLKKEITEFKEKSSRNSTQQPLFSSFFNKEDPTKGDKLTSQEMNLLTACTNEAKDLKARESNLIIMGAPEPVDNTDRQIHANEYAQNLLSAIGFNKRHLKSTYRHNKSNKSNNSHNSIIKIVLSDSNDRLPILKEASKKLKNMATYKDVFVNKDLTPSQRETHRALVTKRKELNNIIDKSDDAEVKKYIYVIRDDSLKKIIRRPESTPPATVAPESLPQ